VQSYLAQSGRFKELVDKNLVQGNPLLGFSPGEARPSKSMEFSTPDRDDGSDGIN